LKNVDNFNQSQFSLNNQSITWLLIFYISFPPNIHLLILLHVLLNTYLLLQTNSIPKIPPQTARTPTRMPIKVSPETKQREYKYMI
jgi:hypothetical protein